MEIEGDAKFVPCYTKLASIVYGNKIQTFAFFDKMTNNTIFKLNAKFGGNPMTETFRVVKSEKGSEMHRLAANSLMNIYQSKDLNIVIKGDICIYIYV